MIPRRFRASKTFTTFVVCVSIFTDILLQNLIVPVLPFALSTRVGLSNKEDIQKWNSILLGSYSGTLMTGCLILGYFGDRVPSRRTPFILGWVVLATSTLCFALGSTLSVLLLARLLEGLSTAAVNTLGLALLKEVVGSEHMGKALGFTSMALSSGQLLGPVIGGVLYEYEGYFQVFLPAFGLLIVEIVLRLLVVEKRRASMTSLGGEAPSTETSEPEYQRDACAQEAGGPDKSMVEPAEPLGVEAQLLLSKAPIARPTNAFLILLACPRFLVAITGLFIMNSIACGFDGVLAPYIHDAFDLKSTHAAALFLAMALPNMFVAPVIGALTDRYGTKLPIAAGCTLAAPTLFLLRFIVPGTSLPFVKLMVVLVFVGMSLACIMPPLGVEASKVVDAIERDQAGVFGPNGPYSQAYGLAYFAVAAGGLVGPLYAGYLRAWLGWEAMSLSMAILSSILFGLVVLFIGEQSGLVQKLSARVEEGEQDR